MSQRIERIEAPSRERFERDFLEPNRPVVLTGVADRWPAFRRWTPEYLKRAAGDSVVTAHYNEKGSFFDWYVHQKTRVDVRIPLAELLDKLHDDSSGRQYYMTEHRLRLVSESLLDDVDFSGYFDPHLERYEPMLFLGRDTSMPAHYHGTMEAFLCQLEGDKRITLYSPEQYYRLYPRGPLRSSPLFSRIESRQIHAGEVDLERFPRFERARPIDFTLRPGEILFIPVHWWHLTAVDGYQASVTHFFRSKLSRWTFPAPGLQTLVREALRPLVNATSRVTKRLSGGASAAAGGHA